MLSEGKLFLRHPQEVAPHWICVSSAAILFHFSRLNPPFSLLSTYIATEPFICPAELTALLPSLQPIMVERGLNMAPSA